ncbi:MAG: glycosyltransferase [Candidatus Nanopelagicales bacterium]
MDSAAPAAGVSGRPDSPGDLGLTASIVIPAHNEEFAIRRGLGTVLGASAPGEFDVVVVANACADRTAAVAWECGGSDVRVIEVAQGGKPNALNLGDQAARAFPRLYLDADVELSTAGARAMISALRTARAAVANPQLDLGGCRAPARAYWQAWQARNRAPRSGTGCYGLSSAGRAAFPAFPDVVGDDQFIARLLDPEVVDSARTVVRPPRTLSAILRRRVRIERGNQQLAHRASPAGQPLSSNTSRSAGGGLAGQAILISIHLAARFWARLVPRGGWNQDHSSRSRPEEPESP